MLWGAIFWIWHGCWNHQHTAGVTTVGAQRKRGGREAERGRKTSSLTAPRSEQAALLSQGHPFSAMTIYAPQTVS